MSVVGAKLAGGEVVPSVPDEVPVAVGGGVSSPGGGEAAVAGIEVTAARGCCSGASGEPVPAVALPPMLGGGVRGTAATDGPGVAVAAGFVVGAGFVVVGGLVAAAGGAVGAGFVVAEGAVVVVTGFVVGVGGGTVGEDPGVGETVNTGATTGADAAAVGAGVVVTGRGRVGPGVGFGLAAPAEKPFVFAKGRRGVE